MIGATGQNPRKGTTHTWDDVQSELCDVALTALVALRTLTPDAREVFTAHLERVRERSLGPGPDRHAAFAAPFRASASPPSRPPPNQAKQASRAKQAKQAKSPRSRRRRAGTREYAQALEGL